METKKHFSIVWTVYDMQASIRQFIEAYHLSREGEVTLNHLGIVTYTHETEAVEHARGMNAAHIVPRYQVERDLVMR